MSCISSPSTFPSLQQTCFYPKNEKDGDLDELGDSISSGSHPNGADSPLNRLKALSKQVPIAKLQASCCTPYKAAARQQRTLSAD